MKKFTVLIIFIILSNIAQSEWQHRYSAENITKYVSDGNILYIGRNNGMTTYDFKTKVSTNLTSLNSDLPGNYVNSFLQMPDNTILVSTNQGIAVIENGKITKSKPISLDYPDNDARDLYSDSAGNIWTFSSNKVHHYKNGIWKTYDLGYYIDYKFDISKLFVHGNQIWALFNDNTETETVYYYSHYTDEYLKIAVIADDDIVKFFQTKLQFPYRQGAVNLTSINDDVILKNYDGVFIYHDSEWAKTDIFDVNSSTLPIGGSDFVKDNKGNIWYIVSNKILNLYYPVSYDTLTKQITEHLNNEDAIFTPFITKLDDGTIVAYSFKVFYFKNDTGWTKKTSGDCGIPDNVYFAAPKLVNGKKYIPITYSEATLERGTIYCLDDGSSIAPIKSDFPYSTITQFGINKSGKGMFKGRYNTEPLRYEADSAFVEPDLLYDNSTVKSCKDGNVYFTNLRFDSTTFLSPYLTTWKNNEIGKIDMGFIDKNRTSIIDFDVFNEYLIALGSYYYGDDSLNSYTSIYNTSNGDLLKYDKNNSCLPDYYYKSSGVFHFPMDTIPISLTIDKNLNPWITTTKSLIKFQPDGCIFYYLPETLYINNFTSDSFSEELLFSSNKKFFFFNITSEVWDSLSIAESGFYGNYFFHKKLLDNRIWACDDKGYMYRYIGKGKFLPFPLQISGKDNLGFSINDFSIDANNYLHLGTDIGLLTNTNILTGIEEERTETGEYTILPNPANEYIDILNLKYRYQTKIQIYSLLGIKVLETEFKERIDVSGLARGLYFIKIGNKIDKFLKL